MFSILWCSQIGDHHHHLEEHLAIFGYKPDMKVNKYKDPSIALATYWNLL
jgi:hypothetical protein